MTGDAVLGILWLIGALLAPQRAEVIASPMTEMLAPQRAEVIASPMTEMSSTGTGTGGDAVDPTHSIAYRPPVDRPISGGFHLESGQYGAGRRGIQYETVQGDQVRAAAGGIVTFAGAVVGRVSVTISHADGRRSTVTGLIEVGVKVDQIVLGGQVIALAAPGLLLTLREGETYVDPALFLSTAAQRARLVPANAKPALGRGASSHYTLPSARSEDRALLRPQQSSRHFRVFTRSVAEATNNTIIRPGTPSVAPLSSVLRRFRVSSNRGEGENRDRSRHHEAAPGSRSPLRTPDTSLEPEDEEVHPR